MIITVKKSNISKTISYIVPVTANDIVLSTLKLKKYNKESLSNDIWRFLPKEVESIIDKIYSISESTLNKYTDK